MDVEIMMLYPAMNKLTQYVPNRYMPVTMAINEVAEGKLSRPDEAVQDEND